MPFAEIDTSEINKKLEAYYERVMKENDSWRQDEQESFDDWFATLQDKLSGDVAANLQLQIDELNDFIDHGSLYSTNTEVFKDLESGFYRLRNYKSDLFPGSVAVTGTMQKNVVGLHHTGTIITSDGVNYTRFADYDSSGALISDTGWKKMSVDTLTTMEQVEASTDDSKAVGAGAVKELSNSLTKVNVYVGDDDKLHFVDSAGADTVLPFSGGWEDIKVVTLTSNLTIDIGRKPKELFVGWSADNVTTSKFNLFSYYNEDFTSYSFGLPDVTTINDNGFTITCKYSGRPVFYAYR